MPTGNVGAVRAGATGAPRALHWDALFAFVEEAGGPLKQIARNKLAHKQLYRWLADVLRRNGSTEGVSKLRKQLATAHARWRASRRTERH